MSILVTGDAGKIIAAAWQWHKGNPDGLAG